MAKEKDIYQDIFGERKQVDEILGEIQKDGYVNERFQKLPKELQHEFLGFCMGNRGLKISYDPFFKYIFNPMLHPERLSRLLSQILGKEVEVVNVLPNESDRISEKDSLLVMDILVRLKTGELANVEIQKVGYDFQGERCSCYSADLLMRELSRKRKAFGANFQYGSMKKVYTIVLIEKSTHIYWEFPDKFIHVGKTTFDTGLKLDMLQEYILLALDVFKEMPHNELRELDAWLYFISSDSPRDINRVIEVYPWFKELFGELQMLRYNTRELIEMYDVYREALRVADANTVKYMVERQQEEIEQQKKALEQGKCLIQEQNDKIAEQNDKIAEQSDKIAEQNAQIQAKDEELAGLLKENERLLAMLENK